MSRGRIPCCAAAACLWGATLAGCAVESGSRVAAAAAAGETPERGAHTAGQNVETLIAAAGRGDKQAQVELAKRYEAGDGVKQDLRLAEQLYSAAANTNGDTDYLFLPPTRPDTPGAMIPADGYRGKTGLPEAKRRLRALRLRLGGAVSDDSPGGLESVGMIAANEALVSANADLVRLDSRFEQCAQELSRFGPDRFVEVRRCINAPLPVDCEQDAGSLQAVSALIKSSSWLRPLWPTARRQARLCRVTDAPAPADAPRTPVSLMTFMFHNNVGADRRADYLVPGDLFKPGYYLYRLCGDPANADRELLLGEYFICLEYRPGPFLPRRDQ